MCVSKTGNAWFHVGVYSEGTSCRLSADANHTSKMESVWTDSVCPKFWTYVAIIVIFILLGGDFECTCKPQVFDCTLYLVLPAFIIFLFVLWTDRSFQRVCRLLCSFSGWFHACSFLGSFFRHIIKAAFIGLLWAVVVLIDGDWYVCCHNDHSKQQAQLACKATGRITEEERVIIAELKNKSRAFGFFLLFGIICVPAMMSPFGWRKSSRKNLHDELILEEEENVLKEILRKSAKDKLTREVKDRLRGEQWEKCFDAAEELIKASAKPIRSNKKKRYEQQGAQ